MEQRKIWSHFQNRHKDIFLQASSRHRFLLHQLPVGRLLNIGAGDGGFEKLAVAESREVYTLDPDDETIAGIAKFNPRRGIAGSIDALPFSDASFDAIVCSEVLEHLDDDVLRNGLAEICRVLKPGGELHGTVPADENLSESETVCPHCGAIFHRWGHVQSFSQARLMTLMSSAIGPTRVQSRVFVTWQTLNWKGKVAGSVRRMLSMVGILGSECRYYFAVRKGGKVG